MFCNLRLSLGRCGHGLKILPQCGNRVKTEKLNIRHFAGLIPMFVEVTEEKVVYIYIYIYIYIYSCVKILEVLELNCLFTHTGFHDFIATQSQLFWFVLLN